MATINVAKEAERPIVEIETLKQCNSNLKSLERKFYKQM